MLLKRFFGLNLSRQYSTPAASKLVADFKKLHTVVAGNGVIVALHPDQPFPYEHSTPLPKEADLTANSPINESLHRKLNVDKYTLKKALHVSDLRNMFYGDKEQFRVKYRADRIDKTVRRSPNPRRGL